MAKVAVAKAHYMYVLLSKGFLGLALAAASQHSPKVKLRRGSVEEGSLLSVAAMLSKPASPPRPPSVSVRSPLPAMRPASGLSPKSPSAAPGALSYYLDEGVTIEIDRDGNVFYTRKNGAA